jgi:hypothetical protein
MYKKKYKYYKKKYNHLKRLNGGFSFFGDDFKLPPRPQKKFHLDLEIDLYDPNYKTTFHYKGNPNDTLRNVLDTFPSEIKTSGWFSPRPKFYYDDVIRGMSRGVVHLPLDTKLESLSSNILILFKQKDSKCNEPCLGEDTCNSQLGICELNY